MSTSIDDNKDPVSLQNQDWEDSLDGATHAMITHTDTLIHSNDSEVIRRFLVTKDKPLFATGTTTKYLEVLYDGSVRIRDVKKSTYSDPIREPWDIFKKDIQSIKSNKKKMSQQILPNKHKDKHTNKSTKSDNKNDKNDKNDKLKIYMDGKSKKRYFKFSTLKEKKEFFDLIESLRKKKDHLISKVKYSSEPFIFAPYEVVSFFIRDSVVNRQGSTIKYKDKLIAITNYRIVVIDPTDNSSNLHTSKGTGNTDNSINDNDIDNTHNRPTAQSLSVSSYNNPLDQASSYKQNKLNRGDHIIPALTVPHHSVYDYKIDDEQITLETKDHRTITINLSNIANSTLRTQSLKMMKRYLLPKDEKDIFAFAGYFSVTRTKTPSQSEPNLSALTGFPDLGKVMINFNSNTNNNNIHNPNSSSMVNITSNMNHDNPSIDDQKSFYFQLRDSRYHSSHHLELLRKEYYRLGFRDNDKHCPFRVTEVNMNYSLCITYPRLLLLPRNAKDLLIRKASLHRSRNRLPVITWSNSYNITISRSSQPQAGVSHKRNEYDERLLLLLNEMNQYSETFVICDCRPRVNAIANQYIKGKGFESGDNYEKAHIIFFDIQNIHEMRKSINALKKCCENQFDNNWLKNLHETQWFQHITKIIQCSRRCANMIDKDKYSVLIHCSDGWDRTAQVAAISQLLLDPYYRTFQGFLLLIQKEWIWFGHKFSDRNANYPTSKKDKDHNKNDKKKKKNHSGNYSNHLSSSKKKEMSPIFLQFLDCTFQIMMQYPWAFDFTQDLLLEFALHCNSGRFGDFFCNSMKERDDKILWLKTPSLFKYLLALWKLGRFRNPDYIPTKTVLRPRYAVRDMILWDEVYCRFTMHDKDRHSSSTISTLQHYNGNGNTGYPYHQNNHHYTNTRSASVLNQSANSNDHNSFIDDRLISGSNTAQHAGKNRYHPRSPRISTKMFKNKNKNKKNPSGSPIYNSILNNAVNVRTKPKPPPPPKNKKSPPPHHPSASLISSNTSLTDNAGDNDNQTPILDPIAVGDNDNQTPILDPIAVGDDDDDYSININNGNISDPDDISDLPNDVKKIALLQKKVRELEIVLKDYRKKEKSQSINNGKDNNIIDPPILPPASTIDNIKLNKSKGNIV